MLQIVTSLSDDSRGAIYDRDTFIVQATGGEIYSDSQVENKKHYQP